MERRDDILFEQQLMELADEIINKGYYKRILLLILLRNSSVKPMDPEADNQNWCGAGKMLAVDAAGNFYPCTRFAAYSLRDKNL